MNTLKLLIALIMLISGYNVSAQVSINEDQSLPDHSAMLDVNSSNRGFLLPRLTGEEIANIYDPANGLIVFNTDNSRFYFFDSIANEWKEMAFGTNSIDPPTLVVYNPVTGRTWMDRNLGASQVATSSDDAAAYGDLYQWGRLKDEHEDRSSLTTTTLSATDIPGHGQFIVLNNSPFDWRNPQNDSLWQGNSGTNNPCPEGFRLPTGAEWETERQSWTTNDAAGAFASPLKLTTAGWRHHFSAVLANVDSEARYWSSTKNGVGSDALGFSGSDAFVGSGVHAYGFSIRCIKDEPIPNQAPDIPSNLSPPDSSTVVADSLTLSWTCSDPDGDTLTYDVYFGDTNPPSLLAAAQADTTYDPGILNDSTTYYWQISAYDDSDTTFGPVWSFTTEFPISWACGDSLLDTRDSMLYGTVLIDSMCWMAENLAYLPSVSPSANGSTSDPYYYVYGYQGTDVAAAKATTDYQTYGVLYNWPAVMNGQDSSSSVPSGVQGVCPSGWHVPSDEEWKILEGEVDSLYGYPDPEWDITGWRGSDVGDNFKEQGTTHWLPPNTGATNSNGFTALPGGGRFMNIFLYSSIGFFWTTTATPENNSIFRYIQSNTAEVMRHHNYTNDYGLSIRCIKD